MQWLIDIILELIGPLIDEKIAAIPPFPKDTVVAWFGDLGDIPNGWILCDGDNETPNLIAVFLRGSGGGIGHRVYGGSNTHTHPGGADLGAGKNRSATGDNIPRYYALWWIKKL